MPKRTFFDMLVNSNLNRGNLIAMLTAAEGRLTLHDQWAASPTTEDSNDIHTKHVKQTRMEIHLLQSMLEYDKFMMEGTTIEQSESSTASSTDPHQHHQHGSLAKDFDSNASSHSASSILHHEAGIEQPKYFGCKRRSLVAEHQQQLSASEINSSTMAKKVCPDDSMDDADHR